MTGLRSRRLPREMREAARDSAVADLYHRHWAGLVRLSLLMLGDRPSAEDVVQDTFAELYRGWSRLRDPERALPYLRSAVLNRSRSVLRRRRVALARRPPPEPPIWSAEHDLMLGEERREVLVALNRLPARRREVLVLRYYLDLSDLEIAETLGISHGAVRSAASRGLAALGRMLKENT